MSEVPVDPESHLWKSWLGYRTTDDFKATEHWSQFPQHRIGSLWAVFMEGYERGYEKADGNGCPVFGLILISGFTGVCGFVAGSLLW